jgi:hypothetical protein
LLSQIGGQIVATETRLNRDGEANQLPQAHRSYEQNCPTKDVALNGAETWECRIKKLTQIATQIAKQNCHATDIALNGMGKLSQIQHQQAYRNCKQNCHTKDIDLNGAGKLVIAASEKLMGIASRTAYKRHCPEWYGEAQGQIQH